ncbi:MAG: tRNA (adenosine(37)-N6)-threonylcarbamoyltransferase complex transferase subunit TsaD, partial [Eubacterium sp.]|nr:tRNA (adenosine(37)-N6)-threonylcarbamoyltransferase complex transferase subunit TsaD [Eubacterium sp.]
CAKLGDPENVRFKRVWLDKDGFDFSFSGIKTGVLNYVNSERQAGRSVCVEDVAAGFQEAVVEVLVEKAVHAVKSLGRDRLVMAGGVSANSRLREAMAERCRKEGIELFLTDKALCTDNAAMIASAAYYKYRKYGPDDLTLDAFANMPY